jgi:hypothetical protein
MRPTTSLILLVLLASYLAASVYIYRRGQASQDIRLGQIRSLAARLTTNNRQRAEANAATVKSIARIVCSNNNLASDVAVFAQVQQIQARTQALVDTMNLLRQQVRYPTTRTILASQVAGQFDRYAAFIKRYTCGRTSNNQLFAATNWFRQAKSKQLPLSATLAALEAALRRCETQALQTQAEKVGSKCLCFDTISPLAIPTTETVAPGGIYQAQLFLAQSGRRDLCIMEMTANGVALMQSSSPGMQVQFIVPARQPGQPDTVRAHWHGTIRSLLFPSDTVLQLDVPYLIVQSPTL